MSVKGQTWKNISQTLFFECLYLRHKYNGEFHVFKLGLWCKGIYGANLEHLDEFSNARSSRTITAKKPFKEKEQPGHHRNLPAWLTDPNRHTCSYTHAHTHTQTHSMNAWHAHTYATTI